jgi:hypothetical protein
VFVTLQIVLRSISIGVRAGQPGDGRREHQCKAINQKACSKKP